MMVNEQSMEKLHAKCSYGTYAFLHETDANGIKNTPCACPPKPCAKLCQSTRDSSSRNNVGGFTHPRLHKSVIAYLRVGGTHLCREDQVKMIESYCALHQLNLAQVFCDKGKPSYGLQEALQELKNHDALVAVNLDSFVEHEDDKMRDLRPFIHHFFCNDMKHLITIQEGVDTGTAAGQRVALEMSSQIKDSF
jgi:hypothetical protein